MNIKYNNIKSTSDKSIDFLFDFAKNEGLPMEFDDIKLESGQTYTDKKTYQKRRNGGRKKQK